MVGPVLLFVCSLLVLLLALNVSRAKCGIDVKDPSGAAVPASGKLQNLATGTVQSYRTGAEGTQSFPSLPFGRYRLEVTAAGFATSSLAIDVQSATPIAKTITLSLTAQAFQVDVVAATPLAGTGLSPEEIPLPVQAGNQRDILNSGALDLSDFLNKRLNGVYVNEMQGNPYQPDLSYRGYTASPLLGTPQGISVYMDGVRLNQPFGDVVSWDLIPRIAISEMALMPGSNPLFGLNTLGGALSLQTKDGRGGNHTEVTFSGGSFGRKNAEFEHGGSSANGLSWYLASNLFFEDGWREHSPSSVRQFFGRLGWQNANTSLGLTASYANNSLIGNGLQEQRLLAADYRSVYTVPDKTANLSPSFNLMGRHRIGKVQFSGNVYQRYIRTNTLNGDLNDDALDQSVYQPSAGRAERADRRGLHGLPHRRGNGREHAVSEMALHRPIAAARRARREMQRPVEPFAHRPAQSRFLRARHLVRDERRMAQPVHRRHRVRSQHRRLPAAQ